jgi:zinc protease
MINSRLENSLIQHTTLIYGYSYHGTYARSKEAYQSFAIVQEDKQLSGLKFWLLKMKEQRNLVLPKLNLIVLEISARYEKQFNDKDKTDSDNCSQFQAEFLEEVLLQVLNGSLT